MRFVPGWAILLFLNCLLGICMNTDISMSYLSKLYRLMIEELRETCVRHVATSISLFALVDHISCIYDQYWGEQRQAVVIGMPEEAMLWTEYEKAAVAFANALNSRPTIATCYSSMDEYWSDAQDQVSGKSPNTIWDIYEHGSRRRLKATF